MDWDEYHLNLCKLIATKSKDPSTKTGAVIVRPDNSIVSTGYNGFPRFMKDDPAFYEDREAKYERIIHCEMNAIMYARESLQGCTLYTYPFLSCPRCAVHVIQSGISRVVGPKCPDDKLERWNELLERSKAYFKEAGVSVTELDFV